MGGALLLLILGVGVVAATHDSHEVEEATVAEEDGAIPTEERNEPMTVSGTRASCQERLAGRTRVEADLAAPWTRRIYFVDGEPCTRSLP